MAAWLVNLDSEGASDEEFAEFVITAHKMHETNDPKTQITKDDMMHADTSAIASHVERCLDEIIFGEECAQSCWWKQEDNINSPKNWEIDFMGESCATMLNDMGLTDLAIWLTNVDCTGASDEEFAEFIILTYKMWKTNDPKTTITKDDMLNADTSAIASKLKEILDEIISSDEVDTYCWWKQNNAAS